MCRIAAYLGPALPLSRVLYDPPHALERQAYVPNEMLAAHVNVDGTGVAWWPDGAASGSDPLRYVSERPPWSDPNLPGLAPRIEAAAIVAAVRSATPGVPFGPGHVAPFVGDGLAFAHNGWLGRFREATGRVLAGRLPDHLHARYDAVNDSLMLFLTVLKHREAAPESGLGGALRAAVAEAVEVCDADGVEATLNVVVSDGERIVACRASHRMEANNPLYRCQGGERWGSGALVASEPLDDAPWEPILEGTMVEIEPTGCTVSKLDLGGGDA